MPHYIMELLVICALLVSHVSSQKHEFIIVSHTRLLYERKYFAGNFSTYAATNMNIFKKCINVHLKPRWLQDNIMYHF